MPEVNRGKSQAQIDIQLMVNEFYRHKQNSRGHLVPVKEGHGLYHNIGEGYEGGLEDRGTARDKAGQMPQVVDLNQCVSQ